MAEFKVLSRNPRYSSDSLHAQQSYREGVQDTLQQVVEMVEGIENPWAGDIDFWQNIRLARRQGFDEALQTIKQQIEEAKQKLMGGE